MRQIAIADLDNAMKAFSEADRESAIAQLTARDISESKRSRMWEVQRIISANDKDARSPKQLEIRPVSSDPTGSKTEIRPAKNELLATEESSEQITIE